MGRQPQVQIAPQINPQRPYSALIAAERIREELRRYGIVSDVNGDATAACVAIQAGLVVWVRPGAGFSWWSGNWSTRGRKRYAWGPPHDPISAARRVAQRYAEAYADHPHATLIMDLLHNTDPTADPLQLATDSTLTHPTPREVLVWPL
ncbi:hypothetical protein [Sphaerisporangium rubeum]|uniref:Uncharacterized protein n=1 Tax=Sphaerisporangium rubeum TaxID=321317 RepID=A0A7X0IKU2_9ACTN|nr:hypothetical protein [Sphaerisporangium rubeum]MBB6475527.1 hypothetical protein [Sphaerisporangium rubeum]